jgi:hypothetical protein
MSQAYAGNYSTNSFNAAKRYKLQFAKNTQVADVDLLNVQDISDSFVRQLISANFPTGSSINNGFKVVQSSSTTNNFTIKGGDGTVNGAGVLFVDGYILFLKSDIEYSAQNALGGKTLVDDAFTVSTLSTLTTPGSARTDEVYVDFYFAEVAADGSEYTDTSLIVSGIGNKTANRTRIVQDVLVAEGGTTPANGTDGNGIYHRYVKIATLNRESGNANILTAMITDNRIKINSVNSYSQGTTITDLLLTNGQNIGNDTHRIDTLYMSSNVDYTTDLLFKNSTVERIRYTTDGKVGIGTTNPSSKLHVTFDANSPNFVVVQNVNTGTSTQTGFSARSGSGLPIIFGKLGASSYDALIWNMDNSAILFGINDSEKVRIAADGSVGIGTVPTSKLHVVYNTNTAQFVNIDNVNTGASSQAGISVKCGSNMPVIFGKISNASSLSGSCLIWNTDNTPIILATNDSEKVRIITSGNVGIGTATPLAKLQVEGNLFLSNGSNIGDDTHRVGTVFMASVIDYSNDLVLNSTSERIRFTTGGNVGIGSTAPTKALVISDGTVNIAIDHTGSGAEIGTYSNHPLVFKTNSIQYMAIDTSGNVGITSNLAITGKIGIGTNPVASLHVIGDAIVTNNLTVSGTTTTINTAATSTDKLVVNQTDADYALVVNQSGNATAMQINNTGTGYGFIVNGGDVGIGTTIPKSFGSIRYLSVNGTNGSAVTLFKNGTEIGEIECSASIIKYNSSYGHDFIGNVGIGTDNPQQKLHIYQSAGVARLRLEGNGDAKGAFDIVSSDFSGIKTLSFSDTTNNILILRNNKVGIGMTDPEYPFNVSSKFAKTDTTGRGIAFFQTNENIASYPFGLSVTVTGAASLASRFIQLSTSDFGLANGGNLVLQGSAGNVGIGTTNPAEKLDVVGRVKCESIYSNLITTNIYAGTNTTIVVDFLHTRASVLITAYMNGTNLECSKSANVTASNINVICRVTEVDSGCFYNSVGAITYQTYANAGVGTYSPSNGSKIQIYFASPVDANIVIKWTVLNHH